MYVERVGSRLHFVRTEHVNWVIYDGPDGTLLIDSGYVGQKALLEQSLDQVGRSSKEIDAVLITHAHADHIGGASWLAAERGIPVFSGSIEAAHARRERLEQVGPPDVLRNAFRPGVLAWAAGIYPLLGGKPDLAVPSTLPFPLLGGKIDVPGTPTAIEVPGHTTGSIVFSFPEDGVVIVGDTIVTGHRTSRRRGPQMLHPMFHNNVPLARASLTRLAEIDAEMILPGHGPSWAGTPAAAIADALEPRATL